MLNRELQRNLRDGLAVNDSCTVPKIFQQAIHFALPAENVRFNLIDGGDNLGGLHELAEVRFQKICDADRPRFARVIFRFHCTINFVEIARWLVNQKQVDGSDIQSTQGAFD